MTWLRIVCTLLGVLGTSSSQALTPLPESSSAFFAGDWIGTGSRDVFCFMRLQTDGIGTVLINGASGDWLGASIRWRNQRQRIVLIEAHPLLANPHRRLRPLSQLSLSSGINQTIQLKLDGDLPVCELQLRVDVQQRSDQAAMLLDRPADARKSNDGN